MHGEPMPMPETETLRDLCRGAIGSGRYRSMTELGQSVGISQPYLSRLISGNVKSPSIQTLQRLATALQTTIDHVVQALCQSTTPTSSAESATRRNIQNRCPRDAN